MKPIEENKEEEEVLPYFDSIDKHSLDNLENNMLIGLELSGNEEENVYSSKGGPRLEDYFFKVSKGGHQKKHYFVLLGCHLFAFYVLTALYILRTLLSNNLCSSIY